MSRKFARRPWWLKEVKEMDVLGTVEEAESSGRLKGEQEECEVKDRDVGGATRRAGLS